MSEVINPYAPPAAAVSDAYAQGLPLSFQKVKLFSAQGRIGRLRLLAYLTAGGFVFGIVQLVLTLVMGFVAAASGKAWIAFIPMLLLIPYFVFTVLLQIQRSHDMDWTGWSVLLAFIPLVGLIWIFKGGTQGVNRFGAPPPPNPLSVKIVGLALPILSLVVIVLGLLFGGVEAYQNYLSRTAAAPAE